MANGVINTAGSYHMAKCIENGWTKSLTFHPDKRQGLILLSGTILVSYWHAGNGMNINTLVGTLPENTSITYNSNTGEINISLPYEFAITVFYAQSAYVEMKMASGVIKSKKSEWTKYYDYQVTPVIIPAYSHVELFTDIPYAENAIVVPRFIENFAIFLNAWNNNNYYAFTLGNFRNQQITVSKIWVDILR